MSADAVTLRAHEVGGTPRRVALVADAAQRAAIAERFDLLALDALDAQFTLKREARGIRLAGEVQASGAQACVASGEPVPFRLADSVAVLLVPAAEAGGDVELGSDDLDVEPLDGDVIDLMDQAAQALALMLDPYPRRPGAVPGILTEDEAREATSPFAVLRKA
jgi:uncharacterized metal-binding protein YceD (DUF177 family)